MSEPGSKDLLGTIFEYVFAIIVAGVFYILIADVSASAAENATGISATLWPMVPAFYVIGILALTIGWARYTLMRKN
jgi:hypothetical protein